MSIEDAEPTEYEAESLIRVVAAVCERDGKVLIAKRPEQKEHGGLWEFPGGKVHVDDRSDQQALQREFLEEFALEIAVGRYLLAVPIHAEQIPSQRVGTLHAYMARILGAQLQLREHQAIAWVLPSELGCFRLAEADRAIAALLLNQIASEA